MAESSNTEDASGDSSMTTLDLLFLISPKWLGNELLCAISDGFNEDMWGEEQAALLWESVEDLSDSSGIYHDDECECSMDNGLYDAIRYFRCTCELPLKEEKELLAELPTDKLAVITMLIEYGRRNLEHSMKPSTLIWCEAPIDRFQVFAQKLDDVVLAICRSLVQAIPTDEHAVPLVLQTFDALQDARNALKAPYDKQRHLYFYHSLACVTECHTTETSYIVLKTLRADGRLPGELIVRTRELYIEAEGEKIDLDAREGKYYEMIEECGAEEDREWGKQHEEYTRRIVEGWKHGGRS